MWRKSRSVIESWSCKYELATISERRNYAEAESAMLAETDRGVDMFPDNPTRASFYENWGDALGGDEEKYREALINWQQFASCATSGGEGTARMLDVNRVLKKIDDLKVML